MKKIFLILFLISFSICAMSQSKTPRFGTTHYDNTGRLITYDYKTKTVTKHHDTLYVSVNAYETIIRDSIARATADTISIYLYPDHAFLNDKVTFFIKPSAGATQKIKWIGSYAGCLNGTASTLAVPASGWGIIVFTWNGLMWIETSRSYN